MTALKNLQWRTNKAITTVFDILKISKISKVWGEVTVANESIYFRNQDQKREHSDLSFEKIVSFK